MDKLLKAGIAQISSRLGDIEFNKKQIINGLNLGKEKGADIVVFPELSLIGFGSGDIYLDKVEENLEALKAIVEEAGKLNIWAIVGYVEKDERGFFYNTAALLGEGEIKGKFAKTQLTNYRLFDEKRYFKPGSNLPVFNTPFGKIGILICEDVWFPEASRALTFRGAEVIFVLSASPFDRGKIEIWDNFLKVRVLDNIIPVVFVNMSGIQNGVTYWGGSAYYSASGKLVKRLKLLEDDFDIVQIDLEEAKRLRRRDIRVREVRREILEEVLKAYEEMSKWI
ncbi:MAG: nitrilase-related carbon-nitrogen hydrolase [bacterium]|nr:nitrilase-related carbon-nitrogen hydrolase [bacterium]